MVWPIFQMLHVMRQTALCLMWLLEMYNICMRQRCFPWRTNNSLFLILERSFTPRLWKSLETKHNLGSVHSHWGHTWLLCEWCSHSKHCYCGSLLLQETPTWPAGSNTMNERLIWADSLVPIPVSTAKVHAILWGCQVVVGTQKGTRALLKDSLKLIQSHMQWPKALFHTQREKNSLLSPAFFVVVNNFFLTNWLIYV